ncbi:hypothetical protein AB1Y20_005409 [Prymnesium parvum]|uniref:Uncharacterized protein n=1 Tax=Prymnesium parvum TaxID=97485 RepID=A0AB34J5W7_PRYPA
MGVVLKGMGVMIKVTGEEDFMGVAVEVMEVVMEMMGVGVVKVIGVVVEVMGVAAEVMGEPVEAERAAAATAEALRARCAVLASLRTFIASIARARRVLPAPRTPRAGMMTMHSASLGQGARSSQLERLLQKIVLLRLASLEVFDCVQAERAAVKSLRLRTLTLAEDHDVALEVKESVAFLAGDSKRSGRRELFSLVLPVAWLPLPLDVDPMLLAWFDPQQLRSLWNDSRVDRPATIEELPKARSSHTLPVLLRLMEASRAILDEVQEASREERRASHFLSATRGYGLTQSSLPVSGGVAWAGDGAVAAESDTTVAMELDMLIYGSPGHYGEVRRKLEEWRARDEAARAIQARAILRREAPRHAARRAASLIQNRWRMRKRTPGSPVIKRLRVLQVVRKLQRFVRSPAYKLVRRERNGALSRVQAMVRGRKARMRVAVLRRRADEITASKLLKYVRVEDLDAISVLRGGFKAFHDLASTKAEAYCMWLRPATSWYAKLRFGRMRSTGWLELQSLRRSIAVQTLQQLHSELGLSEWSPEMLLVSPPSPRCKRKTVASYSGVWKSVRVSMVPGHNVSLGRERFSEALKAQTSAQQTLASQSMALTRERHRLEFEIAESLAVHEQAASLHTILAGETASQTMALKLRELLSFEKHENARHMTVGRAARKLSIHQLASGPSSRTSVFTAGDAAAADAFALQLHAAELRGSLQCAAMLLRQFPGYDPLNGMVESMEEHCAEVSAQIKECASESRRLVAAEVAISIEMACRAMVNEFILKLDQGSLESAWKWLDKRCETEKQHRETMRRELAEKDLQEVSLLDLIERCGRAHGEIRLLDEIESRENKSQVKEVELERVQILRPSLLYHRRVELRAVTVEVGFVEACLAYAKGLTERKLVRRQEAEATLQLSTYRFASMNVGEPAKRNPFNDDASQVLLQELITWWGVDTKQLQLTITDIREIDSDKWGITLQMAMLEGQQSDDMVEVVEITPQLNEIINFMTKELGDPRAIDAEALTKTARVLDVSQVNVEVLSVRPPQLNATNVPTLQEAIEGARKRCIELLQTLRENEEARHEYRGLTQKWHYLKGSVEWLQKLSGSSSFREAMGQDSGLTVREEHFKVLRRMLKVEGTNEEANEVKDLFKATFLEYQQMQATVHVIKSLGSLSKWPEVPVPGKAHLNVDLNWNFPLGVDIDDSEQAVQESAFRRESPVEDDYQTQSFNFEEPRRELKTADLGVGADSLTFSTDFTSSFHNRNGADRVCYYCAQLQPPVRGAHTYIDCAKRKRAGKLEYSPEALDALIEELKNHLADVKGRQMEMQSVAVAAKYSRRKAHELAGAMRMLSLMVQHPPIPATSPPARHKGWRLNKWEKAVELEHSRMRAISVKVARESRLGAGHIAEFRALLCLCSTSCELPLTVSTVRQFADWMHLRLFPKSKDLQKISLAVKLAIAPLPLPWKSVPIGFQNMENGDVIQRHPLHNCFCQLHPSLEDRASTLSELGMLCWWEFAPWATDVERATVLKAIEAGNEEIRLFDMCTGKRADSLRAAMPTLPFPRTDVMPRIQQELVRDA